ncbi:MAG TPA: YdeI/OmpD-associated family protein [Candidatus Limnocylindrales bacterium]|nr:YdeI/OmpD-associated family protein [Candidatus Limnocylindrales bacterium]
MKLTTTVEPTGPTTACLVVPEELLASLGGGRRPAVKVTLNGFAYRTSIAPMGGRNLISVSSATRQAAGVSIGDEVEAEIELDTEPRTVAVPDDLAAALDAEPAARVTFDRLSYSNRSWHVLQIEDAKTAETRSRRVARSIDALREGRPR